MTWLQGVLSLGFLILGFILLLVGLFVVGAHDATLSAVLLLLAMFLWLLAFLFLMWRPSG